MYAAPNPSDFFSAIISGAHRLPNGNTFICSGFPGIIFEVTSAGETVWRYVNPVNDQGPVYQGDGVMSPLDAVLVALNSNLVEPAAECDCR